MKTLSRHQRTYPLKIVLFQKFQERETWCENHENRSYHRRKSLVEKTPLEKARNVILDSLHVLFPIFHFLFVYTVILSKRPLLMTVI